MQRESSASKFRINKNRLGFTQAIFYVSEKRYRYFLLILMRSASWDNTIAANMITQPRISFQTNTFIFAYPPITNIYYFKVTITLSANVNTFGIP